MTYLSINKGINDENGIHKMEYYKAEEKYVIKVCMKVEGLKTFNIKWGHTVAERRNHIFPHMLNLPTTCAYRKQGASGYSRIWRKESKKCLKTRVEVGLHAGNEPFIKKDIKLNDFLVLILFFFFFCSRHVQKIYLIVKNIKSFVRLQSFYSWCLL